MINAPADLSKSTISAFCDSVFPFLKTVPHSVGISYVPIISFSATGIPWRGPTGLPDLL